ncbi:MAG: type II toxin-antitoxin system VapC family toxin [Thermoplasmatota archaeon]
MNEKTTKAKPKAGSKPDAPRSEPATESVEAAAPDFVRRATAAERKAALERVAREAAIPPAAPPSTPGAGVIPDFVRQASPAARKAAVEALAREDIGAYLGAVPLPAWKRTRGSPSPASASASASPAAPEPDASGSPEPPRDPHEPPPFARGRMGKPMRVPPRAIEAAKPPAEGDAKRAVGTSEKRIVILDTNALMMQFQFHVDIEGELRRIMDFAYEIIVPDSVMAELADLASVASGKDAQEARMAMEFAKHFRTMEAPAEGDAGILRLAEKVQAIVVTNDKLLRARLRAKNIPNVHLRSRAFLTLEGHVTGT